MYDNKSVIKWNIQNCLNGHGFGIKLCIEALQFSGDNLRIQTHRRSYMTMPFTNKETRTETAIREIRPTDKTKPSFRIETPFSFASNIIKLDTVLCVYLVNTDNNFFLNNYPYIDIDVVRFKKAQKKFFAQPTNGLCVLPAAVTDEFIADILKVADNERSGMVAKELAFFANGNALRFQKTK